MADEELEAIRRQRMAELQAKHGVRETEKETNKINSIVIFRRILNCTLHQALQYESNLFSPFAFIVA